MNKWAGVVRLGGVGDNLIAASTFRPLKKQGYNVEVISGEPAACVFENNPFVDRLIVKDKKEIPEGDAWQKYFVSRAKEYDKFGHLSHSCENQLALFESSCAFWWPAAVRRSLCDRNYLEFVHDILEVPYDFGSLFFPTAEEQSKAYETKQKVGTRCIGWVLSGTRIDKIYPYAGLAIARIIKELNVPVVMLGAPGPNFEMAKQVLAHVEKVNSSHDGLHLALSDNIEKPNWPIRRILSFAQACDLVIGPDTGVAWSVAFEPMPKIVLLSHASAENITKHWINTTTLHADQKRVPCWPCHRLHNSPATCTSNSDNSAAACMSDIAVEALVSTVRTLWRNQDGHRDLRRPSAVELEFGSPKLGADAA